MSTQVFVQIDGIVNHKHGGVKGWHNPATQHSDKKLHSVERASQPTNAKDVLTDALGAGGISLKAQYAAALKGESFYQYWKDAKTERVANGKRVRGPGAANEREFQGQTEQYPELAAAGYFD